MSNEIRTLIEGIKNKLIELKEEGVDYIPKENVIKSVTAEDNSFDLFGSFAESIKNCENCKLCSTRTNVVFGSGNPNASLVFVGEAPGEQEDIQGLPFVGRAGQLLTKMIEAMGLKREDVYICNVIKCRPPKNRNPEADEIAACEPYLIKQLEMMQPKVIVGLGYYACKTLLNTELPMSKFRGVWHEYKGIKFMPTFHPAYLLRNPPAKKFVWQDLQEVMKEI